MRWPWKTVSSSEASNVFRSHFMSGGIFLLTLLATIGFVRQAQALEVAGMELIFCALTFSLGVSQLAVALLNWLSTLLVSRAFFPRLDYSSGIAPDSRTIVVVPTMLTNRGRSRFSARDAGDSSSGESGCAPAFRFADRLARRRGGKPAGRRGC